MSQNPQPPLVLIFTGDPALANLERALKACDLVAVRVTTLDAGREALASCRARAVAVLDTRAPASYSAAAVHAMLQGPPAVPVLFLLDPNARPPAELTDRDDCARPDLSVDELVVRVHALLVRAGLRTLALPLAAPADPAAGTLRLRNGRTVAVFGPKGGVGATTIAANLALGLVQTYGKQVAAVDGDLWFGDLGVLLNVSGGKSLASLVESAGHLDLEVLRSVLQPHPSGLQVLLGPAELARVETIPPSLVAQAAQTYRLLFDFVIVDVQAALSEDVLQVLGVADQILVVTTPELGALRATTQALDALRTLGWADKLLVVLNRANHGATTEQLQGGLGLRLDATIVSDGPAVVRAENQGVPLLAGPNGTRQVTRDLYHLLELVAGEPLPTSRHAAPSGWRRWLRGPTFAGQPALDVEAYAWEWSVQARLQPACGVV